ncbi:phage holin family protein [Clostridium perfringens]|uniref:Phage holin family protein n=2 Tax=Clostridium perfringens TaxID=1502 RepID=A0AAP7BW94_CLOPF|nr:phage holin family protein [Clostridium perfringens]NP_612848.1 holin [Clostridium phage phi3626]AAL96789.1 holin [Clostridium phage phi3626]EDT22884.1 holin [Clostridium perfringens B str. ATCC 3626]NGU30594.1 phage holin family protein [Clostridium perfringens]WEV05005.1 phage holin family protein [Clostridium perfringens B]
MFKFIPEVISWLLVLYIGFKIIDMILGVLKTIKNKNYRSRKMRDGIIRWVAELMAIAFVLILDMFLGLKFTVIGVTLALFAYKEAGSIVENLGECGVELPEIVSEKLEVLNKNNKNKEGFNKKEN